MAGKKRITAKFRCKELNDIDGVLNVDVAQGYPENNNTIEEYDKDEEYENEV